MKKLPKKKRKEKKKEKMVSRLNTFSSKREQTRMVIKQMVKNQIL